MTENSHESNRHTYEQTSLAYDLWGIHEEVKVTPSQQRVIDAKTAITAAMREMAETEDAADAAWIQEARSTTSVTHPLQERVAELAGLSGERERSKDDTYIQNMLDKLRLRSHYKSDEALLKLFAPYTPRLQLMAAKGNELAASICQSPLDYIKAGPMDGLRRWGAAQDADEPDARSRQFKDN